MHESPVLKLAVSLTVLLLGLGCGWYYLRGADRRETTVGALDGQRPWRKVGAGICVLVAVMFVLGVYLVDIPDHPRAYALYWVVILGLLMWLCALAVKDLKYTWRLLRERRRPAGAALPQDRPTAASPPGDRP